MQHRTRRATVDDLPRLIELWQAANFPVADLEKRFTEFQVAEDEHGNLVAAIALQIEAGQGRIHSEVFAGNDLQETLRPSLWERLQSVARNHGLLRLWTRDAATGFVSPTYEMLQKLPESWEPRDGAWMTLQLREETADPDFVEKQLAMYKVSNQPGTDRLIRQGKNLKTVAVIFAGFLILLSFFIIAYLMKKHK
jgi:N-acetylglutamate synthase-like GNAT family acetyltransferase